MVNTKLIKWVMASDYSARTWGHNPNGWPPLVGDLLLFFLCWVEWFWGSPYVKRGPKKKGHYYHQLLFYTTGGHDPLGNRNILMPKGQGVQRYY